MKGFLIHIIRLCKQNRRHRNDNDADPFYNPVEGAYHLRLLAAPHRLRFCGQSGNIRFISHTGQLCITLSRYHKASRQKAVTRRLFDFVRLTGQKRLIDKNAALQHNGIRTYLASRRKQHHIILYQLLRRNLQLHPASYDNRMRRIQHIHFIQSPLCTKLLYNANYGIADDNRQKGQISKRTDHAEQHGKNQKNQVKIGKCVRLYNVAGCLSCCDIGAVIKPLRYSLLYFSPCQSDNALFLFHVSVSLSVFISSSFVTSAGIHGCRCFLGHLP